MEHTTLSPEMEEMKAQISLLKSKLEKQAIINERLLRKSMKKRLEGLRKLAALSVILCIFAMALCYFILTIFGFSTTFIIFTMLMLLFSGIMTVLYNRKIWENGFLETDTVSAISELMLLKKRYSGWKRFSFPLIAVWYIWLITQIIIMFPSGGQYLPFLIGVTVGLAAGGYMGEKANKMTIDKADILIREIQELRDNS